MKKIRTFEQYSIRNNSTFKDLLDAVSDSEFDLFTQLAGWQFPEDSEQKESEFRDDAEHEINEYLEDCKKIVDRNIGEISYQVITKKDKVLYDMYRKSKNVLHLPEHPFFDIGINSTLSRTYNIKNENKKVMFFTVSHPDEKEIYAITD